MSKNIAQVVVGLPVEGPFDYSVHPSLQKNIQIGMRVSVLFNRQKRVAYVVAFQEKSVFKSLNPILEILESRPSLNKAALALSREFSQYYGCSLGEAIETYLPKVLRQKRTIALEDPVNIKSEKEASFCLLHSLDPEEQLVFIFKEGRKALSQKQSVIVAVPEKERMKALIPLLKKEFPEQFLAAHEKYKVQTEVELFQSLNSGKPVLFLGTRSAIFAALPNVGLIVLWDEENSSFKQEQSPHYHAVEVAEMRARIEPCRLILTSAVPRTETYKKAKFSKWERVEQTADSGKSVQIVDMTNYNPRRSSIVSFPLQNQIQKYLDEGKKILLFLNRRGFSLMTQCNQCGEQILCSRCDIPLTYIFSQKKLVCRQCNATQELPKVCPSCKSTYLRSTGTGIEKIESELARIYPMARLAIFDKDSKRLPAKSNLVIATQAIFRERDRFQPDLIAALNIDSALHQFHYRSLYNVFALIVHLRQMTKEKLVLQTKLPQMVHIEAIKNLDFQKFYREDLKQRKELDLPPYTHMIAVGIRGEKEELVVNASFTLYELFEKNKKEGVEVMDAQPDAIPKLRDQYRYTIMIKSRNLKKAHASIRQALKGFKKRNVIVTVNVDP